MKNKPCMNTDCPQWHKHGCYFYETTLDKTILDCPKYTDKPKKSAWTMARELYNILSACTGSVKNGEEYDRLYNLIARIPDPDTHEESEAISILEEIQEELNA